MSLFLDKDIILNLQEELSRHVIEEYKTEKNLTLDKKEIELITEYEVSWFSEHYLGDGEFQDDEYWSSEFFNNITEANDYIKNHLQDIYSEIGLEKQTHYDVYIWTIFKFNKNEFKKYQHSYSKLIDQGGHF